MIWFREVVFAVDECARPIGTYPGTALVAMYDRWRTHTASLVDPGRVSLGERGRMFHCMRAAPSSRGRRGATPRMLWAGYSWHNDGYGHERRIAKTPLQVKSRGTRGKWRIRVMQSKWKKMEVTEQLRCR